LKDQFLKQWDEGEISVFMQIHLCRLVQNLTRIQHPQTEKIIRLLYLSFSQALEAATSRPFHIDAIPVLPVVARGLTFKQHLSLFSVASIIQDGPARYESDLSTVIPIPDVDAYWLVNVHPDVTFLGSRPESVELTHYGMSYLTIQECISLGCCLEHDAIVRVNQEFERIKILQQNSHAVFRPEFSPRMNAFGSCFKNQYPILHPTFAVGYNHPVMQAPSTIIGSCNPYFTSTGEQLPLAGMRI
jgi:hypothetical protein